MCRGSSAAVYVGTAHCHKGTRLPASTGHMTKSTERPRTRGYHTSTLGAQMLEPSLKYLQKIQTEADKQLQEEKSMTENYLKFKEKHRCLEALFPKTFREFQEVGEAAGMHREKRSTEDERIPQSSLEPSHSLFIFADNGSLDFGTEAKLRADVESCAAGVFMGVGAKQTDAGGKILQRIDDEITRMLQTVDAETGLIKAVKKRTYRWCQTHIWIKPSATSV